MRGRRPNDDVSIPSGTLYIHRTNTLRWQLQGQILTSDAEVAFLQSVFLQRMFDIKFAKSNRPALGSVYENARNNNTYSHVAYIFQLNINYTPYFGRNSIHNDS